MRQTGLVGVSGSKNARVFQHAGRSSLREMTTMSKSATTVEKGIEQSKTSVPTTEKRADQAADGWVIGIDQDGNRHWQSYQLGQVITVIDPKGTVLHSQYVKANLREWKRYVEVTKSGWESWNVNSPSPIIGIAQDIKADRKRGWR